ncbi:MAG: NPCBM/NEW2 domain-containing protein, partial [Planctomycetota bacterium]
LSCRSTWLMRYGDCGYSSKDGTRSWQADRRPRQSIRSAHWRQDDPGVIPSGHVYGNGAPTGMTYFEGESLGERYAGGLLISCEAGQNVVWGYHRKEVGAGFELEGFSFLSTTKSPNPNYRWSHLEKDKRKWFRPSDAAVGISGEVFISDWYDQVVGGHKMNDPDGLGAIYRVVRKGTKPKPKANDYSTVTGMHEALLNPAPAVRHRGLMSLSQFGARGVELLADHIVEGDRPYYRARYLWLLSRVGEDGQERLLDYANDADPKIRLVVYRALRDTKYGLDLAKRFARDSSPSVRREVALSMRDRSLEESTDILYAIAEQYRDRDRFYLEALGTGCDGKEEALYPIFLAKLGSPTLSWTDAFADIVWRLHPATAVPALRERALSSWLTHAQRKQAIDSLAFISESRAAQAMSEIAKKGPTDLRFYATYWLKHRAKNAWSGTEVVKEARKKEPKLKGQLLAESPVLKKGGIDIEADITGAKNLWLIVSDGGDGKSCDWADWVNPVLIDAKGEETPLTQLNWVSAVTGYGNVLSGKNCRGDDLRVGGVKYTFGIGTHADSTVHYDISRGGYVKFRAHVGPDNGGRDTGGADHESGRASVQFRVFGDGPTAMDRALALRKIALDGKQKLDVRLDAARRLAGTAAGGQVLIGLTASRKLPKELAAAVSETIFRNPDLSVRALASQYFRRPGSASKLAVPELLKLKGSAASGKRIFFGAKASCSKCHRRGSEGSDVGPDLSKIREKFDAAGLFDAVLNPSAAVLSGYEAHTIVTKDGRSFSGRIIADGKTVVLKDTEGKEQRIAKSAILLREASKVSLMPDNVGSGLSAAELADLISYLRSE